MNVFVCIIQTKMKNKNKNQDKYNDKQNAQKIKRKKNGNYKKINCIFC